MAQWMHISVAVWSPSLTLAAECAALFVACLRNGVPQRLWEAPCEALIYFAVVSDMFEQ